MVKNNADTDKGIAPLRNELRALRAEVAALRHELTEPEPAFLSVEDAASRLGLSERTVRSFISDGTITSTKIKRRRLIPRSALNQFIEARIDADGEGRS
jgi:excisionase family DNA binding protein